MTSLYINENNILDFIRCNPLDITVLHVSSLNNHKINFILNSLYKFTNLNTLFLIDNKFTKIFGLEKLINLTNLGICDTQLTEINGLDNLVNLQKLNFYNNQIT